MKGLHLFFEDDVYENFVVFGNNFVFVFGLRGR